MIFIPRILIIPFFFVIITVGLSLFIPSLFKLSDVTLFIARTALVLVFAYLYWLFADIYGKENTNKKAVQSILNYLLIFYLIAFAGNCYMSYVLIIQQPKFLKDLNKKNQPILDQLEANMNWYNQEVQKIMDSDISAADKNKKMLELNQLFLKKNEETQKNLNIK